MEKIEIIGTRLNIYISTPYEVDTDRESVGGYNYSATITTGRCLVSLPTDQYLPTDGVYWINRGTKINTGTPRVLTETEYAVTLRVLDYYLSLIMINTRAFRHTYYHGLVESLVCFSGNRRLIDAFYYSKMSVSDLRCILNIQGDHGTSLVRNQEYRRYSISELAEDLVSSGTSLIMDDSIHQYVWNDRVSTGFGNLQPETDGHQLFPEFKITRVQGNQTNANLSLSFDFHAKLPGPDERSIGVRRNLMLVRDGNPLQDCIAIRTNKELYRKLTRHNLISADLPGQYCCLVNLTGLPVTQRLTQKNRACREFTEAILDYTVSKEELEILDKQILWTSDEIERSKEKKDASAAYWAINQHQSSSRPDKKVYTVRLTKTPTASGVSMSQGDLRETRKSILESMESSYRVICDTIFNYRCSKKSSREFFGLPRDCGKKSSSYVLKAKSRVKEGLDYTCKIDIKY